MSPRIPKPVRTLTMQASYKPIADDPFAGLRAGFDADPLAPEAGEPLAPDNAPIVEISEPAKAARRPIKAADRLIKLAESAELFHASDGVPYADIIVNGHRETLPVRGRAFRQWLAREAYVKIKTAPAADAMRSAIAVIEARAQYDGDVRPVALRVGCHLGKHYLDLCDPEWRAIEIDEDGWRLIERPPIRFKRSAGMLPLPTPCRGMGGIERLQPLLNIGDGKIDGPDWTLIVAWLVAALMDSGPYPILTLSAEQGAGKSLACKMIRSLIDPNASPLRSLPREDRDLFIAASNAHILCFDNVSTLQPWQSDTLCRLSSGGGFSTRTLYADSEETIFHAARPLILNGIDDFLTRADAADRAIVLQLSSISETARRPESELLKSFSGAQPAILGDLLDRMSAGLARRPQVRLARTPRLADFAIWATACERSEGAFIRAFDRNRAVAIETVIDADPTAAFVAAKLGVEGARWTGTAGELLAEMEDSAAQSQRGAAGFPKTARAVSSSLKRSAPFLRKTGIYVSAPQREAHTRRRVVTIERIAAEIGTEPSPPVPPVQTANLLAFRGDGRGDGCDAGDGRGTVAELPPPQPSPSNTLKTKDFAGGDDGDGCVPTSAASACPSCGGEGCGRCMA